ncbi:hypothetical protein B0H14DRAFT_3551360 [Mycena olivaceomarginata]|nr:hypothetical protein B0H14DRAFT_3551360 [Mycena olivaceomarginata]
MARRILHSTGAKAWICEEMSTAGDVLAWAHLKARRSKSRHPSPVHCRVRSRQAEDDACTHGLLPSRAAVSRDSTSVLTLSDRPDPAFPVPGWCHTLLLSRQVRYCRGQVWRGVCMAGWTRRHGGRASAGGRRRGRRRGVGGSEAPGTERRRRRVCVRPGAAEAGLGAGWARKRTHRAIRRRTHAVCVGWRRDDVVVNEGELRAFVLELIVAGAAPLGRSGFASTFRSRAAA